MVLVVVVLVVVVVAALWVRSARAVGHDTFGVVPELLAAQAGGEQLGEVDGGAPGVALLDLGAAGEPVGQHDRADVGGTHLRQQGPFAGGAGHLVVAALEPEVAGQAAAAGLEDVDVHPGPPQQLAVVVEPHDRVLVAVHLGQRAHRVGCGG
jgi:hypothetical protein